MDDSIEKQQYGFCGCCTRFCASKRDQDRRLASSYLEYHIGRWLALLGSALLVVGLFIKFFLLDKKGVVDWLVGVLIAISLVSIGLGAVLIIVAAHRGRRAQVRAEDERRLRPTSSTSNSSFSSTNDRKPNGNTIPPFLHVESPLAAVPSNSVDQVRY